MKRHVHLSWKGKRRESTICHMEIWRICTLYFAFCINLNDLKFLFLILHIFHFAYFSVWSGKSLNGKLLYGVKFCLHSAISLRWHAQYLCAQLFGFKARNLFDVCRCVHLHYTFCSVQCFRCVHCALCTVQCAATPLARCHKDTKGTTAAQLKMQKKPCQSQHVCKMHCSTCWSH